jgi:hypothetical protein
MTGRNAWLVLETKTPRGALWNVSNHSNSCVTINLTLMIARFFEELLSPAKAI